MLDILIYIDYKKDKRKEVNGMKKKKRGRPAYLLHLICDWCGHRFVSERFRKYCSTKCTLEVNRKRSAGRYNDLRKALLREQGKLIE